MLAALIIRFSLEKSSRSAILANNLARPSPFASRSRTDPANSVAQKFRKPEITIRSSSNFRRAAIGGGQSKLGDRAARSDAANLVAAVFGKPEITIWSLSDAIRAAIGGGQSKLGDRAARSDAANLGAVAVRKPDVAIRPEGDAY